MREGQGRGVVGERFDAAIHAHTTGLRVCVGVEVERFGVNKELGRLSGKSEGTGSTHTQTHCDG